jgi:hypothetical protein
MARKPSKPLPTPPPLPRANSHERPRDQIRGWLPDAAGKSDPQGTPYTPIGPGTSHWSKTTRSKG